ncbi:MAG: hypothetical protein JSV17_14725 [Candidatus Aminicenantes bacterium]|nr:MAG: hypothetical protein JSV17_14725 [Candidatus Aminicenantes bacterium]
MSEKLEKYLEEISHYLGTSKEKQEILTEIKSHIMEKAEQEFGEVTEESLEGVIKIYGNPREVAEKYMDDQQIIAPLFKGHLFRYTAVVFFIHFTLAVLAFLFKTRMLILPFFFIPKMDNFQDLFYIPMMFIYDLGLVGIILYFVTQSGKTVRLPWPKLKLNWQKMADSRQEKSKLIPLTLMILGYAALVYGYVRYHTLFFKSLNPGGMESLFNPEASRWYSLALLSILGVGILAYIVKFFASSEWVNLLRSGSQLVILGIVINRPIEDAIQEFFYFDIHLVADLMVAFIAVLLMIDFLKSLIILGRKALNKERQRS